MFRTAQGRKRLFFALELPDTLKQALLARPLPLQRGQAAPAGQLHLTIRFLGDVDPANEQKLLEFCRQFRLASSIPLLPDKFDCFPTRSRARNFHLRLKPVPELLELRDCLNGDWDRLSSNGEGRPFRPHITLCRMRRVPTAEEFRQLDDWAAKQRLPAAPATVLTLFHSFFRDNRLVHAPLATVKTRGTD